MIATDSSAWVAILRRKAEADRFLQAIAAADGRLLSSVSLLEASMVLAGPQTLRVSAGARATHRLGRNSTR